MWLHGQGSAQPLQIEVFLGIMLDDSVVVHGTATADLGEKIMEAHLGRLVEMIRSGSLPD